MIWRPEHPIRYSGGLRGAQRHLEANVLTVFEHGFYRTLCTPMSYKSIACGVGQDRAFPGRTGDYESEPPLRPPPLRYVERSRE